MKRSTRQFAVRMRSLAANAPRMLGLVWKASPAYALLTIMLTAITAAAAPAQIWMTKMVIDRVVGATQTGAPRIAEGWAALLAPLSGVLLVWVVGVVCQSLRKELGELMAYRTRMHIECLILEKAAELDMAFYETPAFHNQLALAGVESFRAHNFATLSLDLLGNLLSLGALLAMLARLHPLVVVTLVLTAAPMMLILAYAANLHWKLRGDRTPARRMSTYVAELLRSREAVKEIRLFGLHARFLQQFRQFWGQYFDEERQIRLSKERWTVALGLLSMGGIAGIWLYAIIEAVEGRITIGDVALTFQATEQARGVLAYLFQRAGMFYEHCLFADNLFVLLDLDPGSVEGALARRGEDPVPKPLEKGIEFRHVSFHYPGGDRDVLRDVSFCLRPGETVALVGENGAGKSTLVKLLARLYDPVEGEILVDGRDLRDLDSGEWWRQIGVIFQDFMCYHLSVQENIGFGQVEFLEDRARVVGAAEKGGALPMIEKLPDGFDTVLGKTFEEGVDLSGGEWQKVALSRAFMRDAQVLILDEPTAGLDALAEYEVFDRFAELTAGKTTVFISHRFSTVRMADRILVLRDGQLMEEGAHGDLMAQAGHYARMFAAQADRYR